MKTHPKPQTTGTEHEKAFTLIELLVVIAIIAILAALLVPVLGRAKGSVDRVQCANNLHQLAIAFQNYADDHGDQLPGPAWQGFYPMYSSQTSLFLAGFIPSYLGLPAASSTNIVGIKQGVCPASAKLTHETVEGDLVTKLQQPISYIVSISVTNVKDDIVSRPFGYPYKHLPNSPITTNEPPKRLKEIRDPSLSWAMVDTDQLNAVSLAQYYSFIPPTPTHGSYRNTLFFDWHVDGVKQ
jgi:prepilin-type N-terminal cleavage/methylation domain-containing protein/prepilin-type processing-associated H-X9-DG protein